MNKEVIGEILQEIERLKNKKAQNYYKNYLEKMQKLPLKNNRIIQR